MTKRSNQGDPNPLRFVKSAKVMNSFVDLGHFRLKLRLSMLLAGMLVFLAVASCNSSNDIKPTGPTPVGSLMLKSVTDCSSYKTYLVDSIFQQFTDIVIYTDDIAVEEGIEATDNLASSPGADNTSDAQQPDAVSGTNLQEQGVDEADLVKADSLGNLYIVHGNYLIIAKGFPPAELAELSQLDLGARGARLYLDETGKRLVILANYPYYTVLDEVAVASTYSAFSNHSQIIFVDVSEPTAPVITQKIHMDGLQVNSRRIDDRVHLVSQYHTKIPDSLSNNTLFRDQVDEYVQLKRSNNKDTKASETLAELEIEIRKDIQQAIQETDIHHLLPRAIKENDGQTSEFDIVECGDISRPQTTTNPGLLILSSFNFDGSQLESTGITSMGWNIYASKTNMYIAQTSRWWRGNASESVIHKFAISDTKPEYKATAVVEGWINNQFSMSEHNGFLRIVTSWSRFEDDNRTSTNELFVLQDDAEGAMNVVGEVRGFGPGERIFSARFLGDKGFVVTFRQVDPLFTFDLSDPQTPKLVGEVEILGFSTYMHPLSDDQLLTIGRSGNISGAGRNVQLQIFDVGNLANPQLLHKTTPTVPQDSYSWSEAMYNHLAFTYYAQGKLLVIPLGVHSQNRDDNFNGFALFDVDIEGGFTEIGRSNHQDLTYTALCDNAAMDPEQYQYSCIDNSYIHYAYPRRSVIMTSYENTYLYGISSIGLKAVDTQDPATTLGSTIFPTPGYGY